MRDEREREGEGEGERGREREREREKERLERWRRWWKKGGSLWKMKLRAIRTFHPAEFI